MNLIEGRSAITRPAVFGYPFLSLIPVLVTGIQSAQVLGLKRLFDLTDVRSLDSCDETGIRVVEERTGRWAVEA
jgi:hypothetical protein